MSALLRCYDPLLRPPPAKGYKTAMVTGAVDVRVCRLSLPDLAATEALARRIAALAGPGDLIGLRGELGAGKTTFARFLIAALGGVEEVPSPTFSLVQVYELSAITVWHFDLYRLDGPDDVSELGIEQALSEGLSLIEWPERLGALMPEERLEIAFSLGAGGEAREVRLEARGSWCERIGDIAVGV